ncbi:DUF2934 domain-containing protein [Pseudomonas quasicaspiana]|uniref:DUF2934 domain-containing protein n=1 Tax=Pseudomonas quasicaspiana TaxID=2829821 RepID=UPI001E5EFCAC|nr:DUF2934 domain-containing protein [Pseudomonas quasicaspiana]MCD5973462.1 DUF2934 domain-containing protein [Pseudomonas quasicaspiana]
MSADEKRIREFAYQIWESEGKPSGQDARHWEMARKLAEAEALAPDKSTARKATKPKLPKVEGKPAADKAKPATAKSAPKAAPKPASKPAAAPAAKPAAKPASKPAVKSKPAPTATQAEQPAKPAAKKPAAKPTAKKPGKPSAP